MKLERNSIIAIAFGVTLAILLLFNILTSGFRLELKGILVSIYFAIWVGAVIFVILTFIVPFIQTRKEEKNKAKASTSTGSGISSTPFKSPRSSLPIKERIVAYVTERRREDGLPVPEPLRPSRPAASTTGASASRTVAAEQPSVVASVPSGGSSSGEDLGELPLPDDFGSVDASGEAGSLPGFDDEFGGLDEFGGGDEISSDFGDDNSGLLGDEAGASVPAEEDLELPVESGDAGGLPGFDGDLDSEIGESEIMGDEGMMDLSGDDLLTMDEESSAGSDQSDLEISDGGLSEAGLPDLDGALEPDMMDTDLSGGDEDFGDIEFMDLEPEEPKKNLKK